MTTKRRRWVIFSVLMAASCCGAFVFAQGAREKVLDDLTRQVHTTTQSPDEVKGAKAQEQLLQQRLTRYRRLQRLWQLGQTKPLERAAIRSLDDEYSGIRVYAAQLLGRIESVAAEAPLSRLNAQVSQSEIQKWIKWHSGAGHVRYPELQLALARIRARRLKGWQKIDALAQSVGLSRDELVRLTFKANDSKVGRYAWNTPGYEIMDETIDVMVRMTKHGENIRDIEKKLTLRPYQKIKLKSAKLPLNEQIALITIYLSKSPKVGADEKYLADDLIGLGPKAVTIALERFRDMVEHPQRYPSSFGHELVLVPILVAKDRRALPLLEKLTGKDGYRTMIAMRTYFAITGTRMTLVR